MCDQGKKRGSWRLGRRKHHAQAQARDRLAVCMTLGGENSFLRQGPQSWGTLPLAQLAILTLLVPYPAEPARTLRVWVSRFAH